MMNTEYWEYYDNKYRTFTLSQLNKIEKVPMFVFY